MTEDRALEIIAALGADAARWPEGERDAVLALRSRPNVAAALAEAAQLDALLGGWAQADVATLPFDSERLIPAVTVPATKPRLPRRWLAAGALAAAVAGAVVLTPMPASAPAPGPRIELASPQTPVPSATGASEDGVDAGFAYVFTPTVDEDALI